jgi:hypothetical protein
MEAVIDTKGLDAACDCGSGKKAGNCCKKNEECYCGSGKKVSACCLKPQKAKK